METWACEETYRILDFLSRFLVVNFVIWSASLSLQLLLYFDFQHFRYAYSVSVKIFIWNLYYFYEYQFWFFLFLRSFNFIWCSWFLSSLMKSVMNEKRICVFPIQFSNFFVLISLVCQLLRWILEWKLWRRERAWEWAIWKSKAYY